MGRTSEGEAEREEEEMEGGKDSLLQSEGVGNDNH